MSNRRRGDEERWDRRVCGGRKQTEGLSQLGETNEGYWEKQVSLYAARFDASVFLDYFSLFSGIVQGNIASVWWSSAESLLSLSLSLKEITFSVDALEQ